MPTARITSFSSGFISISPLFFNAWRSLSFRLVAKNTFFIEAQNLLDCCPDLTLTLTSEVIPRVCQEVPQVFQANFKLSLDLGKGIWEAHNWSLSLLKSVPDSPAAGANRASYVWHHMMSLHWVFSLWAHRLAVERGERWHWRVVLRRCFNFKLCFWALEWEQSVQWIFCFMF